MNSLQLAEFLFTRVQETIRYQQYIKEVTIGFERNESYGNDYIRVFYTILTKENFKSLPPKEKQSLFNQTPNYIFSLSTNRKYVNKKIKALRILEFRHIYESLAAYTALQFEKYLNDTIIINVKGIEMWPEANYAEKFLLAGLQINQRSNIDFNLEADAFQWSRLHQLNMESRKTYSKEKEQFNVTDIQIHELTGIELHSIRSVVINNSVPIKVSGIKTVDEIKIHIPSLVAALKKEVNDKQSYYAGRYQALIDYLYNRFLLPEKNQIIKYQQEGYLAHFIIQRGDILQLKDFRIVIAEDISMDNKNLITITYRMLKKNIMPGERIRMIKINQVQFVLKKTLFLVFAEQNPVKHLSLLSKWMAKRKMKIDFNAFEPDLTKEIDITLKK